MIIRKMQQTTGYLLNDYPTHRSSLSLFTQNLAFSPLIFIILITPFSTIAPYRLFMKHVNLITTHPQSSSILDNQNPARDVDKSLTQQHCEKERLCLPYCLVF